MDEIIQVPLVRIFMTIEDSQPCESNFPKEQSSYAHSIQGKFAYHQIQYKDLAKELLTTV